MGDPEDRCEGGEGFEAATECERLIGMSQNWFDQIVAAKPSQKVDRPVPGTDLNAVFDRCANAICAAWPLEEFL